MKTWTLEVALGLKKLGHNSTIIARKGPFVEKAADLGLNTWAINFGPDFNPITIYKFCSFFKKNKIERVLVNVGKDMRTAGVAARLLNIPVIHRVGLPGDMKNKWNVKLMHFWIKPRILVPCEYIKNGLLKNLPFLKPEEITVILTGKEPSPEPPNKVHRPLQFISTSQLNPDKGHKDVLYAFSRLKKRGYDFHYHIVGTGKIENELKQLAQTLGLQDRITWHGFQKDVRKLLRQTDIFLLPSYSEGLPNSLLEAMAERLVPIARDVGGVKEVWPDGMQEFLLPYSARKKEFEQIIRTVLKMTDYDILKIKKIVWDTSYKKINFQIKITELENYIPS
ncbi:glycosyltransferase [Desulfohalobiaceae bacterium Ax17]|uniref:glycosyltransferase n=1 Tax=Desulfovulcanus ferrireducens TaxID=2831190 RepID=UPI00207BABF1|nr:glycosyltransferase [Desulfovulcanus ferrireducens]